MGLGAARGKTDIAPLISTLLSEGLAGKWGTEAGKWEGAGSKAQPEAAGWLLEGRLRPRPQPKGAALSCLPHLAEDQLNSHLRSVGLPQRPHFPALRWQEAGSGRGAGATGSGTCQNTGPRGCEGLSPAGGRVGPAAPENSLTGAAPNEPTGGAGDKKIKGARGMGTRGKKGGQLMGARRAWAPAWGPSFPPLGSRPIALHTLGLEGHGREGFQLAASNLSALELKMEDEDGKTGVGANHSSSLIPFLCV